MRSIRLHGIFRADVGRVMCIIGHDLIHLTSSRASVDARFNFDTENRHDHAADQGTRVILSARDPDRDRDQNTRFGIMTRAFELLVVLVRSLSAVIAAPCHPHLDTSASTRASLYMTRLSIDGLVLTPNSTSARTSTSIQHAWRQPALNDAQTMSPAARCDGASPSSSTTTSCALHQVSLVSPTEYSAPPGWMRRASSSDCATTTAES